MGRDLDIDDVVAQYPEAKRELAQLREDFAAARDSVSYNAHRAELAESQLAAARASERDTHIALGQVIVALHLRDQDLAAARALLRDCRLAAMAIREHDCKPGSYADTLLDRIDGALAGQRREGE